MNQIRSWSQVVWQVGPLSVVGVLAMCISYTTMIDVAARNGIPLPELFPLVVDLGIVSCIITTAQYRHLSIRGRWMPTALFVALSVISVFANASHAVSQPQVRSDAVSIIIAIVLAGTPSVTFQMATHIMLRLIPDRHERDQMRHLDTQSLAPVDQSPEVLSPVSVKQRPLTLVPTAGGRAGEGLSVDEVAALKAAAVEWMHQYRATHGVDPSKEAVSSQFDERDGRRVRGWFRQYANEQETPAAIMEGALA